LACLSTSQRGLRPHIDGSARFRLIDHQPLLRFPGGRNSAGACRIRGPRARGARLTSAGRGGSGRCPPTLARRADARQTRLRIESTIS
jgi:hypothetical protein